MPILSELSTVAKQRRTDMGLSQEAVAALAGLSRATVNSLETGKIHNLSVVNAERLANALGLGLGVTGTRAGPGNGLEQAARVASVSFGKSMDPGVLANAIEQGSLPPEHIPQMRALLDEAPVAVLSHAASELERVRGVPPRTAWAHMRTLARVLQSRRDIWR